MTDFLLYKKSPRYFDAYVKIPRGFKYFAVIKYYRFYAKDIIQYIPMLKTGCGVIEKRNY